MNWEGFYLIITFANMISWFLQIGNFFTLIILLNISIGFDITNSNDSGDKDREINSRTITKELLTEFR